MNYYLTPTKITEALGLTQLRKSTPDGMYLLSESDLVPYGIERAKEEGAIELSNNRKSAPAQEATKPEQAQGEGSGEDGKEAEEATDTQEVSEQAETAEEEEMVNENKEEE